PCAAKVFKSAPVPAPQDGSKPEIVSRMGGAAWLCPFELIVFFCSNDENSRSRQYNAPALANVLALFLGCKKNFDESPGSRRAQVSTVPRRGREKEQDRRD